MKSGRVGAWIVPSTDKPVWEKAPSGVCIAFDVDIALTIGSRLSQSGYQGRA